MGNMRLNSGLLLLGTVLDVQEPKSKLACPLSCTHLQCADGQRQPTNDAGARNPLTRSVAL